MTTVTKSIGIACYMRTKSSSLDFILTQSNIKIIDLNLKSF